MFGILGSSEKVNFFGQFGQKLETVAEMYTKLKKIDQFMVL